MVLFDQFYSFPYSKGSYTNSPGYGTNSRYLVWVINKSPGLNRLLRSSVVWLELSQFLSNVIHIAVSAAFLLIFRLWQRKRKGGEREKHLPAKPMKLHVQNTPKSVAILCFTEIHKQVMKIELVFKGSQKFTSYNNIDKCTIFVLNNSWEKRVVMYEERYVGNTSWILTDSCRICESYFIWTFDCRTGEKFYSFSSHSPV